jgi:MFS family permease
MFWSTSIFQAIMILVSFSVFKETHTPTILLRRAKSLRKESNNPQYQTPEERLQANKSPAKILARALIRPIRLLTFHPIIQITSLISAFYYGILYIVLSTFSDLWMNQYKQSVEISGLHYISCALGEIVGSQIGAKMMDVLYRRQTSASAPNSNEPPTPESRIPLIFPGAIIGPLGLFLYGWAAQSRLHWIIVDIGIFFAMLGMQITGMPMTAYVMEAYPEYTSSAGAASQFVRSLTAFLFPLFAPRLYAVLGYGWGNSTIAFLGLGLGIPAPLVILFFGARLRGKQGVVY